jgi:hypothetical protein
MVTSTGLMNLLLSLLMGLRFGGLTVSDIKRMGLLLSMLTGIENGGLKVSCIDLMGLLLSGLTGLNSGGLMVGELNVLNKPKAKEQSMTRTLIFKIKTLTCSDIQFNEVQIECVTWEICEGMVLLEKQDGSRAFIPFTSFFSFVELP